MINQDSRLFRVMVVALLCAILCLLILLYNREAIIQSSPIIKQPGQPGKKPEDTQKSIIQTI